MRPESRVLLEDMRSAADRIATFTASKSAEDYLADQQLRWSVERGWEIVGEALTQLCKLEPDVGERISEFRKIIGFRNILIHGYSKVDPSITWDIVQRDLPVLRGQLEELLKA